MVQNFAFHEDYVEKYNEVPIHSSQKMLVDGQHSNRAINKHGSICQNGHCTKAFAEYNTPTPRPKEQNCEYRFDKIDPNVRIMHFPMVNENFDLSCSSPDVFHDRIRTTGSLPNQPHKKHILKHLHSYSEVPHAHLCSCVFRSETTVHGHQLNTHLPTVSGFELSTNSLSRHRLGSESLRNTVENLNALDVDSEDVYDSRTTQIVNTQTVVNNVHDTQIEYISDDTEANNRSCHQVQENANAETLENKSSSRCCKMSKPVTALVIVLLVLVISLTVALVFFLLYGNVLNKSSEPPGTLQTQQLCGEFPEVYRRNKHNTDLNLQNKNIQQGGSVPATFRSMRRQPRVLGGSNTKMGEFPWQVSLWLTEAGLYCGGTIILKNWIVTAAHCTNEWSAESAWTAYVGVTNLNRRNDPPAQKLEINHIIQHPKFDSQSYDFDIALMQLKTNLIFTEKVQAACIPPKGESFEKSTNCYVSGWGVTQNIGVYGSAILQHAQVDIFNTEGCNSLLQQHLSKRMMCAGKIDGSSDACKGDSGGPLSCYSRETNLWYLSGVVSWGEECGLPDRPGVYTQTSVMTDWIWNTIGEMEDF